jgi:hypothetical protein
MKTMTKFMFISMLMIVASSVQAEAIQIFNCEYVGEATNDDVLEMSDKWLKAAKTIKGGENIKVYIRYPLAASSDDIDFKFVLVTPDFAEWGEFTDAYEASEIVKIDDEIEKVANCNDSSLWEGEEIK